MSIPVGKSFALLALLGVFSTAAAAEQLSGTVLYNSKDSRVLGLQTAAGPTALAYGPDMQFTGVAAMDGVKACDEIEVDVAAKGQSREIRAVRLSRKGDPASCQIPATVIVPASDLYRALQDKSALVVDVRTPDEFAKAHFDGAVSIPLPELAARAAELPKDKPVILYCATARRSALAAAILRVNGINATYVKGKFSVNDGKPQIIE
jgi:rhodanese-related sulfurtransferase